MSERNKLDDPEHRAFVTALVLALLFWPKVKEIEEDSTKARLIAAKAKAHGRNIYKDTLYLARRKNTKQYTVILASDRAAVARGGEYRDLGAAVEMTFTPEKSNQVFDFSVDVTYEEWMQIEEELKDAAWKKATAKYQA